MSTIKLSTWTLVLVLATGTAYGVITYVDANPSTNTFDTITGSTNTGWYETGTNANSDSTWRERGVFGNGGLIYEGGYASDDPELTTQITGLSDGTHNIWVFFWDSSGGSNAWNIAAGLTSGSLTTYSFDGLGDTSAPVLASTLDFASSLTFTESDRTLYGVNLGLTPVTGGALNVYIDNGGTAPDDRTWYDGVGYEFIPEPSTAILAGLGLAAVCLRRRKRNA